jgi:hypothetical protein
VAWQRESLGVEYAEALRLWRSGRVGLGRARWWCGEKVGRVRSIRWQLGSAVVDCHFMQVGMWRWLYSHGVWLWRGEGAGGP